jgi:hypothetical protein
MARETKAQRNLRVSTLAAAYDAASRELRKLTKDVDAMKEELRQVDPGAYGEWSVTEGTPREILDQPAARRMLAENGLKVPTVMTTAPVIVRPVAGK